MKSDNADSLGNLGAVWQSALNAAASKAGKSHAKSLRRKDDEGPRMTPIGADDGQTKRGNTDRHGSSLIDS